MNAPNTGRVPPHDLNAERAVLGGMLLENRAIDVVADIPLRAADFYRDAHGLIFEAMLELAAEHQPVDGVTLRERLATTNKLARVGGDEYLLGLTDTIPVVDHIEAHARIVREKAVVRNLIHACYEVAAKGYGDYGAVEDFLAESEVAMAAVTEWRGSRAQTVSIGAVVDRVYEHLVQRAESGNKLLGYACGLHDLDQLLYGFCPGKLYYVTGRPGSGKTALAQQITIGIAQSSKKTVGVLSLEMPEDELGTRMMSMESQVNGRRIQSLTMNRDDWDALARASDSLSPLPIEFFTEREMGVLDLRRGCRRLKRERGLAAVIIDYVQLMRSGMKAGNREEEVSQISRNLKLMAIELQIAVVALAQLNRGLESRPKNDRRPQISDIRESGSTEQDADVVIACYRDEMYNPETEDKGIAELIVGKHRGGACGTVRVGWQREYTRFVNLERHQEGGSNGGGPHWSDR